MRAEGARVLAPGLQSLPGRTLLDVSSEWVRSQAPLGITAMGRYCNWDQLQLGPTAPVAIYNWPTATAANCNWTNCNCDQLQLTNRNCDQLQLSVTNCNCDQLQLDQLQLRPTATDQLQLQLQLQLQPGAFATAVAIDPFWWCVWG